MDWRVRRINKLLKEYDKQLYCRRDAAGTIHVYRKAVRFVHFKWRGQKYAHASFYDQYIISLTDNWFHDGKPVDWGLEPIWRKFLQMDSWRDDTGYDRWAKSRDKYHEDQDRMRRNEFRAIAADMRKDFAKATNDFVVRKN